MAAELPIAHALEARGRRAAMEDAHILETYTVDGEVEVLGAIFDGHLGSQVANYAASRFSDIFHATPHDDPLELSLAHALEQIHREVDLLGGDAGACAAAFHFHQHQIVTANLGDTEIVYVPDNGRGVEPLTTLHRLDTAEEILRVYHAKAIIQEPYYCEVVRTPQGLQPGRGLMPTRSLGDRHLDQWGLSHAPAYSLTHLEAHDRPGFLVAACDGFWDVIKAAELHDLILTVTASAQHVADILFKEALEVRQTTDNLSLIVVRIE